MKYYIVFLDFDTDVIRIDTFDNEEAFNRAVLRADQDYSSQRYPEERDWFMFSTWQE